MNSPRAPELSAERAGIALCVFLQNHAGASVEDLAPLLRLDPDLHVCQQGFQALSWACWEQHTDVVRTLIDAGAPVHGHNDDGSTALHIAISRGGCALKSDDPTPWHDAQTITALLIERGADVHLPAINGSSPFSALLQTCGYMDDEQRLYDPQTVGGNIRAHAHERRASRAAIMGQLLDAGADILDLDRYAEFDIDRRAASEVEAFLRSRTGTPTAARAVNHLVTLMMSGEPNATWAAAALADAGSRS